MKTLDRLLDADLSALFSDAVDVIFYVAIACFIFAACAFLGSALFLFVYWLVGR